MIGDYLKSNKVKVFPSSYRGQNINPESELSTEANFVLPKAVGNKNTYIISWDETNKILKCIIGGYYFNLNLGEENISNLNGKFLCIRLKEISIIANEKTTRLDSWVSSGGTLDVSSGTYKDAFVGLKFSSTKVGNYALPFLDDKGNAIQASFLPQIEHGSGDNSLVGGSECTASAKNSAALGTGTTANQENLVAIGTYNGDASSGDLFIVGNGTTTTKSTVLQVNKAGVVISEPTTITGDTSINGTTSVTGNMTLSGVATITGNTTINGNEILKGNLTINTNKFKVNATSGNTEVAGSFKACKNKFSVEDNLGGSTTITEDGDVNVTGKLSVGTRPSGKIKKVYVDGGVDISGNLGTSHITESNETLQIDELTIINNKLIVGENRTNYLLVNDQQKTVINQNTEINGTLKVNQTGSDKLIVNTDGISLNATTTASEKLIANKGLDVDAGATIDTANIEELNVGTIDNDKYPMTVDCTGKTSVTELKVTGRTTLNSDITKILLGEKTLKETLLNLLYPVGSIYTSTTIATTTKNSASNDCEIGEKLGGTWERIAAGRCLIGAGNFEYGTKNVKTYTAGDTGGDTDTKLIKHTHTGTTDLTKVADNLSISNFTGTGFVTFIDKVGDGQICYGADGQICYITQEERSKPSLENRDITATQPNKLNIKLNHGHTIFDNGDGHSHDITTNETGALDNGTNANMPPYLVVYMWRRTA